MKLIVTDDFEGAMTFCVTQGLMVPPSDETAPIVWTPLGWNVMALMLTFAEDAGVITMRGPS